MEPLATSHNGAMPMQASSRPTFLMCPPRHYEVNYVINPWMAGNVHRSSRQQATEQWEELRRALREFAQVELVEPQPGSPDMVFTANAGLVRNGIVALSSFQHKERQGEEPHFRRWFSESGFAVRDTPRVTPFEGEGDALFEGGDGGRVVLLLQRRGGLLFGGAAGLRGAAGGEALGQRAGPGAGVVGQAGQLEVVGAQRRGGGQGEENKQQEREQAARHGGVSPGQVRRRA